MYYMLCCYIYIYIRKAVMTTVLDDFMWPVCSWFSGVVSTKRLVEVTCWFNKKMNDLCARGCFSCWHNQLVYIQGAAHRLPVVSYQISIEALFANGVILLVREHFSFVFFSCNSELIEYNMRSYVSSEVVTWITWWAYYCSSFDCGHSPWTK